MTREEAALAFLEAKAALTKAQAKREAAEARKVLADAKASEARARLEQIHLERQEEERNEELVSDEYLHVFRFASAVGEASVAICMQTLERWARLDAASEEKPGDVEVVFTSPGGSVLHGMALFDYLRSLSRRGYRVVTTDLGYSASMAGILLQAGDWRRIGAESYLHIHEISTGAIGKVSEIKDEVKFADKITDRVVNIFVSRSDGKLTAPKLRKMFERQEAWFSADEALKYGLVDEII